MNFLAPSLVEYRPSVAAVALSEPYHPRPEPLTPIPEQLDSPDLASKIVLSCSSADSLGVSSADSAIHFVDEASGTVISRVQHASGSRISAGQFVLEPSSLTSSLSLHIGSPPSCDATDIDAHIESLPAFMLTLPTPISPQFPMFSPEVHFTTEKLLDAAESADPEQSLPHCDHVLGGKLCPNTSNCAVRASMDVGASYPSGVGLGLTECGDNVQDDDDDIDDPGSLAIEAPPPENSRLALLNQRVKGILRKARAGFGLLFPPLSTLPLGQRKRG